MVRLKEGKVLQIGGDGLLVWQIERVMERRAEPPIEFNLHRITPCHSKRHIVRFCQSRSIECIALMCNPEDEAVERQLLGPRGKALDELAASLGRTPMQVELSWYLQRGLLAIPPTEYPPASVVHSPKAKQAWLRTCRTRYAEIFALIHPFTRRPLFCSKVVVHRLQLSKDQIAKLEEMDVDVAKAQEEMQKALQVAKKVEEKLFKSKGDLRAFQPRIQGTPGQDREGSSRPSSSSAGGPRQTASPSNSERNDFLFAADVGSVATDEEAEFLRAVVQHADSKHSQESLEEMLGSYLKNKAASGTTDPSPPIPVDMEQSLGPGGTVIASAQSVPGSSEEEPLSAGEGARDAGKPIPGSESFRSWSSMDMEEQIGMLQSVTSGGSLIAPEEQLRGLLSSFFPDEAKEDAGLLSPTPPLSGARRNTGDLAVSVPTGLEAASTESEGEEGTQSGKAASEMEEEPGGAAAVGKEEGGGSGNGGGGGSVKSGV